MNQFRDNAADGAIDKATNTMLEEWQRITQPISDNGDRISICSKLMEQSVKVTAFAITSACCVTDHATEKERIEVMAKMFELTDNALKVTCAQALNFTLKRAKE